MFLLDSLRLVLCLYHNSLFGGHAVRGPARAFCVRSVRARPRCALRGDCLGAESRSPPGACGARYSLNRVFYQLHQALAPGRSVADDHAAMNRFHGSLVAGRAYPVVLMLGCADGTDFRLRFVQINNDRTLWVAKFRESYCERQTTRACTTNIEASGAVPRGFGMKTVHYGNAELGPRR